MIFLGFLPEVTTKYDEFEWNIFSRKNCKLEIFDLKSSIFGLTWKR